MSKTTLLLFEGGRIETQIFHHFLRRFFPSETKLVKTIFDAEIYQLWKKLEEDDDLELSELIRERHNNSAILADISREDIDEIFLFFDYDGHATGACDAELQKMLLYFNEETENGKLYISYPMAEALKHISSEHEFEGLTAISERAYKDIVSKETDYQDLRKLTIPKCEHIIKKNVKQMNHIVNGVYDFPNGYIEQLTVFENQLEKYIIPMGVVVVLSAFPLFIKDYFRSDVLAKFFSEG